MGKVEKRYIYTSYIPRWLTCLIPIATRLSSKRSPDSTAAWVDRFLSPETHVSWLKVKGLEVIASPRLLWSLWPLQDLSNPGDDASCRGRTFSEAIFVLQSSLVCFLSYSMFVLGIWYLLLSFSEKAKTFIYFYWHISQDAFGWALQFIFVLST